MKMKLLKGMLVFGSCLIGLPVWAAPTMDVLLYVYNNTNHPLTINTTTDALQYGSNYGGSAIQAGINTNFNGIGCAPNPTTSLYLLPGAAATIDLCEVTNTSDSQPDAQWRVWGLDGTTLYVETGQDWYYSNLVTSTTVNGPNSFLPVLQQTGLPNGWNGTTNSNYTFINGWCTPGGSGGTVIIATSSAPNNASNTQYAACPVASSGPAGLGPPILTPGGGYAGFNGSPTRQAGPVCITAYKQKNSVGGSNCNTNIDNFVVLVQPQPNGSVPFGYQVNYFRSMPISTFPSN